GMLRDSREHERDVRHDAVVSTEPLVQRRLRPRCRRLRRRRQSVERKREAAASNNVARRFATPIMLRTPFANRFMERQYRTEAGVAQFPEREVRGFLRRLGAALMLCAAIARLDTAVLVAQTVTPATQPTGDDRLEPDRPDVTNGTHIVDVG